jgi:hypothetical protein
MSLSLSIRPDYNKFALDYTKSQVLLVHDTLYLSGYQTEISTGRRGLIQFGGTQNLNLTFRNQVTSFSAEPCTVKPRDILGEFLFQLSETYVL